MVPATASRTASQSPIRRQTTIPVSTTVFTALDKAKLTLPNRWPSLPLPRLRRRLPAVTVKMAKRSNGDEVDEDKKKKTLIRSFFLSVMMKIAKVKFAPWNDRYQGQPLAIHTPLKQCHTHTYMYAYIRADRRRFSCRSSPFEKVATCCRCIC